MKLQSIFSFIALILLSVTLQACDAKAADSGRLAVIVSDMTDGGAIPEHSARCVSDGRGRTKDGDNAAPSISWTRGPAGTKSYAVMMVDQDMPMIAPPDPTQIDPGNPPIPADAPRTSFYQWVVADIPAKTTRLSAHGRENGVVGQNGYNGPCPPWNDERMHHYHFQVFALDIPTVGLPAGFNGAQLEAAMQGHILAQGEAIGTDTTNTDVIGGMKSSP